MEAPVYVDKETRWAVDAASALMFFPIIFLLRLQALDRRHSGVLLVIIGFIAVFCVGLFLLVHLTTNVWIGIDPADKKISQRYKFFAWPIYQRTYDLSQFDRISLHRAFRGGYRATLIGREREVVVVMSSRLGVARGAAERAATITGLRISDQL